MGINQNRTSFSVNDRLVIKKTMGLFRTIPLQLPPFSDNTPKSIIQIVTEKGLFCFYLRVSTGINQNRTVLSAWS